MSVPTVSIRKLKGFWRPLLCSLALHVLAVLALLAGGWMYHAPGQQVFQVLLPPSRPAAQLPAAETPLKRPRQPVQAPWAPKSAAVAPKPAQAAAPAPAAATPTAAPATDSSVAVPSQPDLSPPDEAPVSATAPAPDVAPASGVERSPAGTADPRAIYLAKVRGAIEARKNYPALARRSRQQGTVVVHFHLSSDGLLLDHGIVTSSGRSLLDRAALQALEQVGRFPTLPEALGQEILAFEVPVVFRLDAP